MGDRHGGRFARRGRPLSPLRPQVDAHRGVVGRICPAQERSPRRRLPDTAHEQKNLPRAGTLSSTKASRHGARAKGFAPRRNTPLGEGLPTRRTSERICPRAGTLPTAKASRHGARAKRFAPRRNTPLGESLPTRRTSERICLAREGSPRQRPPDTAHGRRDLPRAGTRPSAKASRHGARAKGFAPQGSRSPHVPTNGGPPSVDGQPEKHPFGGVAPTARGRCRVHSPKKIRLLHETQLFYGESHVGSRQIFLSFPSVGRCAARERNPVPPVAPHRGSGHRGLRRTGEMVRRFDAMCPHGSEWLPRSGRCDPSLRYFGERFHRRRCANPDACGGRRCARGHDDLGQRTFRCARPTFRNRRRSGEKTCGGRRCSRGHDDLGQRAFRYFRPAFRNRRRSGE